MTKKFLEKEFFMSITYSAEVEQMCCVAQGPNHGPAPLPEEGKWIQAKQITDISGFTHGVGWCAPQQGTCKLSLNVKGRRYRGGSRRDHRMFRNDPLCRYGGGDSSRQDHS